MVYGMSVCRVEDIVGAGLRVVSDTPVMDVAVRICGGDSRLNLWFFFGYLENGDRRGALVVFTRTPDIGEDAKNGLESLYKLVGRRLAKVYFFDHELEELSRWFGLAYEKRGFLLRVILRPEPVKFLSYYELALHPPLTEWFSLSDPDVEIVRQIAEKLKKEAPSA